MNHGYFIRIYGWISEHHNSLFFLSYESSDKKAESIALIEKKLSIIRDAYSKTIVLHPALIYFHYKKLVNNLLLMPLRELSGYKQRKSLEIA
jgi:hypothetical protein